MMRDTELIVSGVAQANTGQTTVAKVPEWAKSATFYLNLVAAAGTTPLTDYVIYHAVPKITDAVAIATTQGGGGGNNETQTVTLTGGPTHGTWSLTWPGVSAANGFTVTGISPTATAAQLQTKVDEALYGNAAYRSGHIVVTRSGSGTAGTPYIYTLTFSGATVANTNVDQVTVNGTGLHTYTTDTAHGIGNAWNGITQIAGTTAGSVRVRVGPALTGVAEDDTGPVYSIDDMLPEYLAHTITFDRTSTNETYTYSLYAVYSS